MYVATIQQLNYSRQESKQESKTYNLRVYISDTPVTMPKSQVNQTYNENVDPKQGFSHAKFQRSHYNSVQEKANIKVFF